MNKTEAIEAIKKGFKIVNKSWYNPKKEFVYFKDGKIYDEKHLQIPGDFWSSQREDDEYFIKGNSFSYSLYNTK